MAVAGLFERSTTLAYVALASVMSFLVVPVVMHWLWSTNGWYDVCVLSVCVCCSIHCSIYWCRLSTRNPANAIVYVLDFGVCHLCHSTFPQSLSHSHSRDHVLRRVIRRDRV